MCVVRRSACARPKSTAALSGSGSSRRTGRRVVRAVAGRARDALEATQVEWSAERPAGAMSDQPASQPAIRQDGTGGQQRAIRLLPVAPAPAKAAGPAPAAAAAAEPAPDEADFFGPSICKVRRELKRQMFSIESGDSSLRARTG